MEEDAARNLASILFYIVFLVTEFFNIFELLSLVLGVVRRAGQPEREGGAGAAEAGGRSAEAELLATESIMIYRLQH